MLSVALCTYNGASFIEEQLSSILRQLLPVDEIVICDDNSSDNTLSLIHLIANQHSEISWTILKNSTRLGVTKNFEKALSLCRGEIVFLSDQDDVWLPEKTQTVVDFFSQHPRINLVFSDAELIDETGHSLSDKTLFDVCGLKDLWDEWNNGLQFEIENVLQRLLGATMGIRRAYLIRCLPFRPDVSNYHDGQLAMQSVIDMCNGRIDKALIHYRIHPGNVVGLGGNKGGRLSRPKQNNGWAALVEPRGINPYFTLPCAASIIPRVRFFQKRNKNYSHVVGKMYLAVSVIEYIKYYRQYWYRFYFSDLLYGVSERIRQSIIRL